MSGRYVPPARRNNNNNNTTSEEPKSEAPNDALVTLEEIRNHFWPVSEDEHQQYSTPNEGRTLHDSAISPGKLSYVILFANANPRWDSNKIIFTKSRLEFLPAELADAPEKAPAAVEGDAATEGASVPTAIDGDPKQEVTSAPDPSSSTEELRSPIAAFRQVRGGQQGRSFEFDGWYQIDRLTFLEPRSAELIRMLEQKWTRSGPHGTVRQEKRDQQSWEASLRHRWAVLKLKPDENAQKERGIPKVDEMPDQDRGAKESVNEMLARLRMGDAKEAQA